MICPSLQSKIVKDIFSVGLKLSPEGSSSTPKQTDIQLETLQSSASKRQQCAEGDRNPFKCVKVTKVGQVHPQLLLVQRLHLTYDGLGTEQNTKGGQKLRSNFKPFVDQSS